MQTLKKAGYQAFIVGGFVRGALLRGESFVPSDLDIATSAQPEEIRSLFEKVNFVGQSFGVSLVHVGGHSVEVATFRTEGPYSDGRRPDFVRVGSHYEDSCRRDFTINALYYDPINEEVIDFHGGMPDAFQKILRTVGNAGDRIAEDLLRVLRMCRFAAQDRLEIDPLTWQAALAAAPQLTKLARERVVLEIQKTPSQSFSVFCGLLADLGLEALLWSLPAVKAGPVIDDAFQTVGGLNDRLPLSAVVLMFMERLAFASSSEVLAACASHVLHWPTTVEDRRIVSALLAMLGWLALPEQKTVQLDQTLEGALCGKVGHSMFLAALAHLRRFSPLPFQVLKTACTVGFGQRMSGSEGVGNNACEQKANTLTAHRRRIWFLLLECGEAFLKACAGGDGVDFVVGDLFSRLQTMGVAGLNRKRVIQMVHEHGLPSASQVLLDVLAVAVLLHESESRLSQEGRVISACALEVLEALKEQKADLHALVSSVQQVGPTPFS